MIKKCNHPEGKVTTISGKHEPWQGTCDLCGTEVSLIPVNGDGEKLSESDSKAQETCDWCGDKLPCMNRCNVDLSPAHDTWQKTKE